MTEAVRIVIDAVGADGAAFPMEIAVGVPFLSERLGTWACNLTLHPLWPRPADVAGVDALQALCMALGVARSMLDDFTQKGGKLLIDGEPFPIDAYFGSLNLDNGAVASLT